MNNIERRDKGLAYISDEQVFNQQKRARILTQKLNTIDRSDYDGINKLVKQLFGKCEDVFLNPPFYCDYGFNIEAGKNLFVNYSCTIIDVAKVKIGDNCWIGGNSVICPGVHIGNNVVIGGGSIVTKDIPDMVVAVGNPCRVIKKISDDDKRYLYKDELIDDEAWDDII